MSSRTPNRRIKWRSLVDHALHGEGQLTSCGFMAVANPVWRWSLDPLSHTVSGHTIESKQRIAAKGNAPSRRGANIGAEYAVLEAHSRVGRGRECEPPECRPEHRWRGDESTDQVTTRCAYGLANQHGAPAAKPSADEKIEAGTVWRGNASDTLTAHMELRIAQLPVEDYAAVPGRQLCFRQHDRCGGARQRPKAWGTRHGSSHEHQRGHSHGQGA
jgi:hypothetical protein